MTASSTRMFGLGLVAAAIFSCAESPPAATASASAPASACQAHKPACGGAAVPSYDTDVRPILAARCFKCHANGGVAADEHDFSHPETTRAQQVPLTNEVASCAMPPSGEPPLSANEASVLLSWASCGTK